MVPPTTPLGYFQLFFTREMLEYLTEETNRHASFRLHGDLKNLPRWMRVNIREMAHFIGLVVLMGMLKFPEIRLYWSTDDLYYHPVFGNTMSINRFKDILRFFHTFNDRAIPHGNTDQLIKVRTLVEYINAAFRAAYTPRQELALDEGSIPWRGHLTFNVSQKKPEKNGIKISVLSEAKSGYIHSLEMYTGMHRHLEDTVNSLMSPLLHKGYRLYTDNYYNSVSSCESLFGLGVHMCGFLHLNRGAPQELQEAARANLLPDTLMTQHKGNTMVMVWKDVQRVTSLVTSFHSDDTVVKRRRKKVRDPQGRTTHTVRDVKRPALIDDHSQNINGITQFDQMTKNFPIARHTQKWTKKFAFYCVQMALHNAYVLYKKYSSDKPQMTLRKFQDDVVRSLLYFQLEEWSYSGRPLHHAPDILGYDIKGVEGGNTTPIPPLPLSAGATAPLSPSALSASISPSSTNVPSAGMSTGTVSPATSLASAAMSATLTAIFAARHCQRDEYGRDDTLDFPPPTKRARIVSDSNARLNDKLGHTLIKVGRNKRKRCRVCSKKGTRKDTQFKCAVCDMFLCLGQCYALYHQKRQFWL